MTAKILIVDDEKYVRLNYRMTLETEGYTIFEAVSGAAALEELVGRSFDLAILDMRMPGMDGLELLAKMREFGIGVPAMIVTAYSDVPHAVKAMKLGAIDFLQKPLQPEELRRIVTEILKRHAPQKEQVAESFNSHIIAAKRCLNLRSFAMARIHLAKALELNNKSVEAFNTGCSEAPTSCAFIRSNLGSYYMTRGQWEAAELEFAGALKLREGALGEHPLVADSLISLSRALRKLSRKQEAKIYETRAARIWSSQRNPAYDASNVIDARAFRAKSQ